MVLPAGERGHDRRSSQERGKDGYSKVRIRCLGCGVCVSVCPKDGVRLAARKKRVITPVNSTHRAVLVFDNQAHLSHRTVAAILGVLSSAG